MAIVDTGVCGVCGFGQLQLVFAGFTDLGDISSNGSSFSLCKLDNGSCYNM